MQEEVKKLKDDIWKTRKSRINASERLLNQSNYVKFINLYFSCFLIIINIIDITSDKLNLSVISLILSIILTISLVFLDSKQYLERSSQLKKNYISLQQILYEVDDSNYKDKRREYINLMNDTENHNEDDFLKVLIDTSSKEISLIKYTKYHLKKLFLVIFKLSIIVIPVVITYILVK